MHCAVRSLTLGLVASLLVFATTTERVATQDPSYGVIDVGTLGGAQSTALAMDHYAWSIVGSAQTVDNARHAFDSSFGRIRDLGTLGGRESEATAVSNAGSSAGFAQRPDGSFHAFLCCGASGLIDLGTLGGSSSWAYGINDASVVVGSALTADTGRQAFIYSDGAMRQLTLGTVFESEARDINNADQVVGWFKTTQSSPSRAFLWANGVRTDLGALASGAASRANAINEDGIVVGQADTDATGTSARGFRWQNGSMQALPTLHGYSGALAINQDGTIAGYSHNAQGQLRAVIWRQGQVFDLNDMIKPGSGWVLEVAHGIGIHDAVVGVGRLNGVRRAFFLVPALDFSLSFSGHWNDEDTNIPSPHEAGSTVLLGVTVHHSTGPFMATGVTVEVTIAGPFEYTRWDSNCIRAGQQLTCDVPPWEGSGLGRSLFYAVRATGPGQLTHSARITGSDAPDPEPGNNSATETNTAVSLASLSLADATTVGGQSVLARIVLTDSPGIGGAHVDVSTSHPDVVTAPSPVGTVPWVDNGISREFYLSTKPVAAPVDVQIRATYGLRTYTQTLTVMPAGVSFPYGGSAHSVPGLVQAEDYDGGGQNVGYYDTGIGNDGDAYRDDDVDLQPTADAGGGYNVGWMARSEWLQYTVSVASAGTYRLELRVAANGAGGRVHVEFNGVDKTGPLTIPNTGGWQKWTTIGADVSLSGGMQRMRVIVDSASASGVVGNLNYIQLRAVATGPQSTPLTGTPASVPGIIEAEAFDNGGANVAYRDTSAGNAGGAFRPTDVDIQSTTDASGVYNVGWMAPGEWLVYSVNVASAGNYRVDLRVAANGAGGRLHVEFDGVDKTGPLTIPNTGGWQAWTTISAPVTLSAGIQRMRVVVDAAGPTGVVGNLNFIQLISTSAPASPADIVIYAQDIPAAALHGGWTKGADPVSPFGIKLQTPDNGVAVLSAPLASPTHYVDVTFTPVANTPYTLWLRLQALGDSKYNDAVWVQFSGAHANGAPVFAMNSTSGLLVNLATDHTAASLNQWGWVNGAYWLAQPATFTFPSGGTQTLRIQLREDGVALDQIVLSPMTYLSSPRVGPTDDATIVQRP